jgi:hypothetical protein
MSGEVELPSPARELLNWPEDDATPFDDGDNGERGDFADPPDDTADTRPAPWCDICDEPHQSCDGSRCSDNAPVEATG